MMENLTEQMENVSFSYVANGTTSNTILDYKAFDEAAAVIAFFLFFAIVVLNGLVIYVLIKQKKKKNKLFYFVLHLAVADFLVGLVCVLGDGIQSSLYGAYYGGDILCRIWRYGKSVVIMASNNILIGMSVDRFLAIKYPLETAKSANYRYLYKALVFGAWCFGLVSSSLLLPYVKGINASLPMKGSCDLILPNEWWEAYVTVIAVFVYILPTLGITTCYVGICIVIWKSWKSGLRLSEISNDRFNGETSPNTGLLPRAKVKSIQMTIAICLAFFICWTPYFVIILLDVHTITWISDRRFFVPLTTLYPLNSACNPLIFMLFNRKLFRRCPKQLGEGNAAVSAEAVNTQVTTKVLVLKNC